MPGMMLPVVAYAPTAATKPSIAAHPLNLSASGVICFPVTINGRLAMLGLVIGTINYGLFGWIAPGLF